MQLSTRQVDFSHLGSGLVICLAFSKRKLCNGENFQIKDFDEFRCLYVCMYVVCMYVFMYGCMYLVVYVCMYLVMYVCYLVMYIFSYVCMYVCMFFLGEVRRKCIYAYNSILRT